MHAHEGCPEYALTIYDIQGHKLIRKCCFATVLSVGLHPEECQVVTTSFAASLGLLTTSGGLSKTLVRSSAQITCLLIYFFNFLNIS